MKKRLFIAVLCMLLTIPMVVCAEEYVSFKELREQVYKWNAQYVDSYGRSIVVDVQPIIPESDRVAIITAEIMMPDDEAVSHALNSENVSIKGDENEEAGKTYLYSKDSKQITIAYRTGSSYINFVQAVFKDSAIKKYDSRASLVERELEYYLPHSIDYNQAYLKDNTMTAKDCIRIAEEKLGMLFPENDLDLSLFRLGVNNWNNTEYDNLPYYSCVLRQCFNGIPVLMGASDSIWNINAEDFSFNIPKEWKAFTGDKWGQFDRPFWELEIYSEDMLEMWFVPLKEKYVMEEDVPLCSFDRVVQSIESRIQSGNIRNIHSLRFGYCCYLLGDEVVLYPVWEIECDYAFNPRKEMEVYPEFDTQNVTSGLYYRTMIVNAQTGEFMDPVDLKENILNCPEILCWDDIR